MAGLDQPAVRRVNTGVVLRALADGSDEVTLQELVSSSGLSRRTVELILSELGESGWVASVDPAESGGAGRPAKRFRFVAEHRLVAAALIDTHTATVAIADLRGKILARNHASLEEHASPERTVARVSAAIRETISDAGLSASAMVAGAVAAGGVIDERGVIARLVNAPLWREFPLASAFESEFGVPWLADNDANLAALAEHWSGASQDSRNSAWLVLGARTGAGFILNGAVHRGARGGAGELVESRVLGLDRADLEPIELLTSPVESDRARGRAAVLAALDGEPEALRGAAAFAERIADVIDVLFWTIEPELIVFGGGLEDGTAVLIPLVRDAVRRSGAPDIDLVPSSLGSDAAVIGAIRRALDAATAGLFSPLDA